MERALGAYCERHTRTHAGLDPLILAHHMTTVAIIIVIGMELIWRTSKRCVYANSHYSRQETF